MGHEPSGRRFQISAERPEVVRTASGPELVADHVAGRLPEWSLLGDELMVVTPGRMGAPDGLPERLAPLLRIADRLERGPT